MTHKPSRWRQVYRVLLIVCMAVILPAYVTATLAGDVQAAAVAAFFLLCGLAGLWAS